MNYDEIFEEMWFTETYDEVVREHPEGIALADIKRIVGERYAQAVLRGDLPGGVQ